MAEEIFSPLNNYKAICDVSYKKRDVGIYFVIYVKDHIYTTN